MTEYPTALGSYLQQAREEAGITQDALADKLGVTRNTVSRWEVGPTKSIKEKYWGILIKEIPQLEILLSGQSIILQARLALLHAHYLNLRQIFMTSSDNTYRTKVLNTLEQLAESNTLES